MNLPPTVHVSGSRLSKEILTYGGIDPITNGHIYRARKPGGTGMDGERDKRDSSGPWRLVGINTANETTIMVENLFRNLAS